MRPVIAGWPHVLDEVEVEVDCGRESHAIAWRRGKLVLVDHQLNAELAAMALGGPPPRCLEVLEAWRRCQRTARPIKDVQAVIGFRAHNITMAMPFYAALLPEPLRVVRERTTWIHVLRERGREDRNLHKQRSVIQTLRRIAIPAIETTLATVGGPDVDLRVEALPAEARPIAHGQPGRKGAQVALVALPISWLTSVALLDATIVDGRFVLALDDVEPDSGHATAPTLRWRRTTSGRLAAIVEDAALQRVAGEWRVA